MGIENTAARQPGTCCMAASLPLMGIENLGQRRDQRHVGEVLITPHGDRKLEIPEFLSDTTRYSLPLMGIENPLAGRVTPARSMLSLPLMGIENGVTVGKATTDNWGSLPLMGIENVGTTNHVSRVAYRSLPLMGIENPVPTANAESAGSSSLPLMGIENAGVLVPVLRKLADLITPHGDRKHRNTPAMRAERKTHYPSWGSKTGFARLRRPLGIRPHYPSWGSKTIPVAQTDNSCVTSLPLMGIENAIWYEPSHSSSRSSLPLMGIENLVALKRLAPVRVLHSLPLMGIENH